MKYFAYFLVGFGIFWIISRLLNHNEMMFDFKKHENEGGYWFAVRMYLRTELGLGWGCGTIMLLLGLYLLGIIVI
jgi:hypothetical protein